ncbi:MAG: hypothetical protein ACE5FU_14645, partial [Nitrospinota bacterium]
MEFPVKTLLARIHEFVKRFYPRTPTRKILPVRFQVLYKVLRSVAPLFTDVEKANARVREELGKIIEGASVYSLFVCDNGSGALNRFIVEKCKKKGIPSISLPHGIMLFSIGPGEGKDDFVGMNMFDA